jgi:hypothetical protein
MKKGGLARALQARQTLDHEPEPERQIPRQRRETTSERQATVDNNNKSARRFHTTIYPDSREMYNEIKIALIRENRGRDFNRLVNDLLAAWLEAPGD